MNLWIIIVELHRIFRRLKSRLVFSDQNTKLCQKIQSFCHMLQVMKIRPIEHLTLTEIIKSLVQLELVFCYQCFYVYFELILLAFRYKFETFIIALNIQMSKYFLKKHLVNVLIDVAIVDYFVRGLCLDRPWLVNSKIWWLFLRDVLHFIFKLSLFIRFLLICKFDKKNAV